MSYLSKERMVKIREGIKNNFPGWKFSIRSEKYSTVIVTILEAPYNLLPEHCTESYYSPNEYHLSNTYQGQALIDLTKISEIATNQRSGAQDGDYGFVPDWYFDLQIGTVEKPFVINRRQVKPTHEFLENIQPKENENKIELLDYSDASFAVFGPTKHLKIHFAQIGRPNFNLVHPVTGQKCFGWIFSKKKKSEVAEILLASSLASIND